MEAKILTTQWGLKAHIIGRLTLNHRKTGKEKIILIGLEPYSEFGPVYVRYFTSHICGMTVKKAKAMFPDLYKRLSPVELSKIIENFDYV